ncbi:hypothetical protein BH24DEI2_BH24DEI2_23990 [soil metagenome]
MINLVAVQAEMRLEDYRDSEAFRRKILALTERAVSGLPALPTLLAFPETIGLPLLLTLGDFDTVSDAPSVSGAAFRLARARWRELLGAAWRHRSFGLQALYVWRALPAYRTYHDAFSEAARRYGVTVVAGSSFLPHIEAEAARGLHVADKSVHNTAFTFGETGTVLNRTHKVYLNEGAEAGAGLSRGRLSELQAVETSVGRVGVALCLDAFYGSVLARFDGMGVQIVVQPSANHAPWDRPWLHDPALSEGTAWLRYGLRAGLQNRLHIRYGVNPMLVGDLWDLSARGRSSIVVNGRYAPQAELEGYAGLLALAPTPDREAFVRATVNLYVEALDAEALDGAVLDPVGLEADRTVS